MSLNDKKNILELIPVLWLQNNLCEFKIQIHPELKRLFCSQKLVSQASLGVSDIRKKSDSDLVWWIQYYEYKP